MNYTNINNNSMSGGNMQMNTNNTFGNFSGQKNGQPNMMNLGNVKNEDMYSGLVNLNNLGGKSSSANISSNSGFGSFPPQGNQYGSSQQKQNTDAFSGLLSKNANQWS